MKKYQTCLNCDGKGELTGSRVSYSGRRIECPVCKGLCKVLVTVCPPGIAQGYVPEPTVGQHHQVTMPSEGCAQVPRRSVSKD